MIIKEESKNIVEKINFSQLENKSVLVTGASGLVGIYMLSCLNEIKEKHNIKVSAWVKNEIHKPFEEIFSSCNIIRGDITNYGHFTDLPEFDVIIHSAGYGQPIKFTENKLSTIQINTTSTIELLKKLKKGGKFLFVSSSEVYNGIESPSIKETQIGTTNTDHFRACYIEGKRCGEAICHSYIEKGIDVKIVRLSLAYGPGTKIGDKRVLNSLIQKGLDNDVINLMDNGEAIRTYCYITNVVEMFWKILLFGKDNIYNVGGKSQISILDLANLIAKKLGKKVVLPNTSNQLIGNPRVVNISTDKYISEFGETNIVPLDEGLEKTIDWQKQILKWRQ